MLSLVTRRLIRLVIVLAGVSLVTFAILQVSGDPIALMMPEAPEADRAVLRQSMGFNDPLPAGLQLVSAKPLRICSSTPFMSK